MKWCVLVYIGENNQGPYEKSMGVYEFQELPRIGDEISIGVTFGSMRYTVIKVSHEFIKPSSAMDVDVAKEHKVIVYVK